MKTLWEATAGLADVLRPSPIVSRFGRTLPGTPQSRESELSRLLQELFAQYGLLDTQPLLLSLKLGHIPGTEALARGTAGEEFRTDSIRITSAALGIVEWLRSRMRRYPIRFRLPYTDPFSPRVVDQGFPDSHWPWLLDLRRAGFQRLPTVAPQVANDLRVDAQVVRDALAALSWALTTTPVWSRYEAAEAALTPDDEAVLVRLVAAFRSETRPDAIDVVEPGRVMRRMHHRQAAISLAEDRAREHGGTVAEYYASFRALDKTLGDVVALLSQLLFYGPPRLLPAHRAAWRRDEEEHRLDVSFRTEGFLWRLNEVVRLNVEVVSLAGLVVIEGYSLSFHRRGDSFIGNVQATGVVLSRSSESGVPSLSN